MIHLDINPIGDETTAKVTDEVATPKQSSSFGFQDGLSIVLWGVIIYNGVDIIYMFAKKYFEIGAQ